MYQYTPKYIPNIYASFPLGNVHSKVVVILSHIFLFYWINDISHWISREEYWCNDLLCVWNIYLIYMPLFHREMYIQKWIQEIVILSHIFLFYWIKNVELYLSKWDHSIGNKGSQKVESVNVWQWNKCFGRVQDVLRGRQHKCSKNCQW